MESWFYNVSIKYGHRLAVGIVKDKNQKMNRAGKRLNLSDDEVELLGHMKDDPPKGTFWDNQNQVAEMTARDQ